MLKLKMLTKKYRQAKLLQKPKQNQQDTTR